jgi:hypothetical protein
MYRKQSVNSILFAFAPTSSPHQKSFYSHSPLHHTTNSYTNVSNTLHLVTTARRSCYAAVFSALLLPRVLTTVVSIAYPSALSSSPTYPPPPLPRPSPLPLSRLPVRCFTRPVVPLGQRPALPDLVPNYLPILGCRCPVITPLLGPLAFSQRFPSSGVDPITCGQLLGLDIPPAASSVHLALRRDLGLTLAELQHPNNPHPLHAASPLPAAAIPLLQSQPHLFSPPSISHLLAPVLTTIASPVMSIQSGKGISAMPSLASSKAPGFSGETSKLLEFFELFEDLAIGCALQPVEKCKSIVRYVNKTTKRFWVSLPGYLNYDYEILKKSILE